MPTTCIISPNNHNSSAKYKGQTHFTEETTGAPRGEGPAQASAWWGQGRGSALLPRGSGLAHHLGALSQELAVTGWLLTLRTVGSLASKATLSPSFSSLSLSLALSLTLLRP